MNPNNQRRRFLAQDGLVNLLVRQRTTKWLETKKNAGKVSTIAPQPPDVKEMPGEKERQICTN